MQIPDFRSYVATKRSTINGKDGHPLRLSSHDKVLWNYDGAIGIKNGYTVKAGATFVAAATRGGHTLIVTVLHAQARVWPEIAHLLDWGFAAEKAGAAPLGRLPDPPAPPGAPAAQAAKVRAAAAHTREEPTSPLVPIEIVGGAGLVVFLLVRRRRGRGRLKLDLPL
jgi:D-alanyl-D-alanine carboxypeptidase (penicillin-binding protein 5/6)